MENHNLDIDLVFNHLGYQKTYEDRFSVTYEHFCQKLGYLKTILIYISIDGITFSEPHVEIFEGDGDPTWATENELSAIIIKMNEMKKKYGWGDWLTQYPS